jgi:predicted  nucleic acid-binding Zn-ribbon protein
MSAAKELKAMEEMYAIVEELDPAEADRIYFWARATAKKTKAQNRFVHLQTRTNLDRFTKTQ